MATEEFFLAINPDPTKQSVHIDKTKYELMRALILGNLQEYGPMTFRQLGDLIEEQLQDDFDGSVTWCFTTVKLDLEARGEICRVPKFKPQLMNISYKMFCKKENQCMQ